MEDSRKKSKPPSEADICERVNKVHIPKAQDLKRRDAAVRRLDIDKELYAITPNITETLISIFGGSAGRLPREVVLNFLKASRTPASLAFVECYQSIPYRDRRQIPFEAVCVKAQVNPMELLGCICHAAKQMKGMESALKAIMAHPDVLDTTILASKSIAFGSADRKVIHDAVGFLPQKAGSSINLNFTNGKPQLEAGDDDADAPDDDDEAFTKAFPLISAKLENWSSRRRLLTEGKA